MRILVYTTLFPNNTNRMHGIFVKHRVAQMADMCDDVAVIAPVPYFPDIKYFKRWYRFRRIPREEVIDGIKVYHPRYIVTPKIFRSLYGLFMFFGALKTVITLDKAHRFDIIDSHFAYPDGFAAVLTAKLLGKKVAVTARGTDVNDYPRHLLLKLFIRYAFKSADWAQAVSKNLKEDIKALGMSDGSVEVVSNGVDKKTFFISDRVVARRILGIPEQEKVLLSVGYLIKRKNHDALIRALGAIKGDKPHLYIIGEGPYRKNLERSASELGLSGHVRILEARSQRDLQKWYSAADLFCLASHKEGRPNVVIEALACGTPVITRAGWDLDEIINENNGILINRCDIDGLSKAMADALSKKWLSRKIRSSVDTLCWAKTTSRIIDRFDSALRSKDILFFASEDWDSGQKTSKHHLAENLSKEHRVIFIESIGLRTPKIGGRDMKKIFRKIRKCLRGIRKVNERLYVFTPLAMPFHGISFVKRFNAMLLRAQMWFISAKLRLTKPIYWTFLPSTADMLAPHKEDLVYYCVDDMSAFTGVDREMIKEMDNGLARNARVVFAVSEALYESKKELNRNTYYMPHGVDFEHFANGHGRPSTPIFETTSPVIGFFGLISEDWIDFALLSHIARRHPEWSIVMIGKIDVERDKLPALGNITYTGQIPFDDLPSYARLFDVAVIPFNVSGLTKHCNPLKVYEYCAAGKPVVSVDIPELRRHKGMVRISRDKEEFVRNIEECLANDAPEEVLKRIEFARKNSWEEKTDKVWDIVKKHF